MTRKSYAKLNIFLKIVGQRGGYHELLSRFVTCKELYDTICFMPKKTPNKSFELIGDFGCEAKQNTITKAYNALRDSNNSTKIDSFFTDHSVHVKKNIPELGGLGGGSSNAATFLLMCDDILKLKIKKEELARLGLTIGADVPFFIYGYESANVSGVGEVVEEFEEELLSFELFLPKVQASTKIVFEHFRENFFNSLCSKNILGFTKCTSQTLLETFTPLFLNDLYQSSMALYPKLQKYYQDDWFMSGSGSSMFRMKNG